MCWVNRGRPQPAFSGSLPKTGWGGNTVIVRPSKDRSPSLPEPGAAAGETLSQAKKKAKKKIIGEKNIPVPALMLPGLAWESGRDRGPKLPERAQGVATHNGPVAAAGAGAVAGAAAADGVAGLVPVAPSAPPGGLALSDILEGGPKRLQRKEQMISSIRQAEIGRSDQPSETADGNKKTGACFWSLDCRKNLSAHVRFPNHRGGGSFFPSPGCHTDVTESLPSDCARNGTWLQTRRFVQRALVSGAEKRSGKKKKKKNFWLVNTVGDPHRILAADSRQG